jgi:TRAP-type transport system periplasmic protein
MAADPAGAPKPSRAGAVFRADACKAGGLTPRADIPLLGLSGRWNMVPIAGAAAGAAHVAAAALLLALLTAPAARAADDKGAAGKTADGKTYVMKISIATVGDALHQYARNYAAAVGKDSGGRIKAEIYPASQLGSIQQQAEGVQFGAIQCQIVPPEFLAGIDERFEVLTAPGLVTTVEQGQRLAGNPAVRQLMLGLGADKGLRGAALFMNSLSAVVARRAVRHLADFKGKKIRIFASEFQSVAMQRLGAIPKPMTLGEVRPALQDNALDAAVTSIAVLSPMHFQDVAKYVTETGQPAIFGVVELSRKWYDSLPPDLQQVVADDAAAQAVAINPAALELNEQARKAWGDGGGELISLPADEQSAMLQMLASVGADLSRSKPPLRAAYKIVSDAAK